MSTTFQDAMLHRGQAGVTAKKILEAAKGFGATSLEQNILLGLAAAESAFDENAQGAMGELGAFQIEKGSNPTLITQTEHALRQVRDFLGERPTLNVKPLNEIVDMESKTTMKLVRAQWQRGAKALGAIKRWGDNILQRIKSVQATMGMAVAAGAMTQADVGKNAIKELTKNGKLGVKDFIEWSKAEGSDVDALEKGQKAFTEYMEAHQWNPAVAVAAGGAIPETSFGAQLPGAATDVISGIGKGLGASINAIFQGVKEGFEAIATNTAKYIIPPVLVVGGSVLLYNALKNAWKRGDKEAKK